MVSQFPADGNYCHINHLNHHLKKQLSIPHRKIQKNGKGASVYEDQRQHQIKQVIKFTQSIMQTLSEYEKQFQELFNIDLAQTEIQSIFRNICLQKDSMIY